VFVQLHITYDRWIQCAKESIILIYWKSLISFTTNTNISLIFDISIKAVQCSMYPFIPHFLFSSFFSDIHIYLTWIERWFLCFMRKRLEREKKGLTDTQKRYTQLTSHTQDVKKEIEKWKPNEKRWKWWYFHRWTQTKALSLIHIYLLLLAFIPFFFTNEIVMWVQQDYIILPTKQKKSLNEWNFLPTLNSSSSFSVLSKKFSFLCLKLCLNSLLTEIYYSTIKTFRSFFF
jgi:hypothetical protein